MAVHRNPTRSRRHKSVNPINEFLTDALAGLAKEQKELPCKYFYDEHGSQLFDAICELDEYYVTRTELTLMRRCVCEMAAQLGRECLLVEYGAGSSIKTRLLFEQLEMPAGYAPVDISGEHLHHSARSFATRFPHVDVRPIVADFTKPFGLPVFPRPAVKTVVYFPGSTIGNFTPTGVAELLLGIVELVGPGGGLLIGIDLKKDVSILERAYDDAKGVTAAFNLNLLTRLNRELGSDFRLDQFVHRAIYNAELSRIEMHLMSMVEQVVHLGGQSIEFRAGETIHTENSHKFCVEQFRELAANAGLCLRQTWTDDNNWFGVLYLEVSAEPGKMIDVRE